MPYRSEKILIAGSEYDKRKKISEEMRMDILSEKGVLSQRVTARKYGVSRRSVVFIWYPERLVHAKELYKERRLDGRYYNKEKQRKAMQNLRRRKQKLFLDGDLSLTK